MTDTNPVDLTLMRQLRDKLTDLRNYVVKGGLETLSRRKRRDFVLDVLDTQLHLISQFEGAGHEVGEVIAERQAMQAKLTELCNRLEAVGEPVTDRDRDPTGDLHDGGSHDLEAAEPASGELH